MSETILSDCFAGVAAAAKTGTAALDTEAVLATDWPWALLLALALVLATVVALVLGVGALF